jgi:UDP-3-O-[3-hydroxymyristoyl] glucosamine N-acyltransferase
MLAIGGRRKSAAVLVKTGTELPGHDLLEVPDPYVALAEILEAFHPPVRSARGVSPDARLAADVRLGIDVEIGAFAVLESGVEVGDRAVIGAGSVLGEGVRVGPDTVLKPRVVLYPGTRLGARCLLHSGAVLGADGFGFATSAGKHRKIPHIGGVVVGDDVEIGANSTVDRGALADTEIGAGTKIDDLVMVAHGVRVGPDCILVGQSGIAGSTRVGARVTLAGQAGVAGHLSIGDGVVVAAKSAVFEDVPAGSFVAGIPAVDHREWKRAVAGLLELRDLRRELRSLKGRLEVLERERGEGES